MRLSSTSPLVISLLAAAPAVAAPSLPPPLVRPVDEDAKPARKQPAPEKVELPRVRFVPLQAPEDDRVVDADTVRRLSTILSDALQVSERFDLAGVRRALILDAEEQAAVDAAEAAQATLPAEDASDPTSPAGMLAAARTTLAEAQALAKAEAPDLAQVAERLAPALETLSLPSMGGDSYEPRLQALLLMAQTRLAQGDAAAADALLSQYVRIAPGRAVDAAEAGPVADRLLQLRATLLASPPVSLEVRADMPALKVRLDAREVGTTPLRLDGLVEGAHNVAVVRDGALYGARQLEVRPGEDGAAASVHFDDRSVGPALTRALESNQLPLELLPRIQAEGTTWRSGHVLFAGLRASPDERETIDLQPFVLRSSDGALQRLPVVSFPTHLLGVTETVQSLRDAVEASLRQWEGAAATGAVAIWSGQPLRPLAPTRWNTAQARMAGDRPRSATAESAGPALPRLVVVRTETPEDGEADSGASEAGAATEGASQQGDDGAAVAASNGATSRSDGVTEGVPGSRKGRPSVAAAALDPARSRLLAKSGPPVPAWALWTGVGVGTAALVGGAVLLFLPRSSPTATVNLTWGSGR